MQYIRELFNHELQGLYSPGEISSLIRLILTNKFGISHVDILTCKFNDLSVVQLNKIKEIIVKLKKMEPIQYILGETFFFDLDFQVNGSVLIPRPETEELIQWIIDETGNKSMKILDIGTGSGCIAVTLAKKLSKASIQAWDISQDALDVAQKNAANNSVDVNFQQIDVLNIFDIEETFDIIVSNPPYITEMEKIEMEENVLKHEPHIALFVPDNNPLIFYEKISSFAQKNLNPNGKLYFEINRDRGKELVDMLQDKGFIHVELRKDISGNDRMIRAVKV